MFESALLEKHHSIQSRRKSATLVSLILEATVIGALIVIPLLVTQALPAPKMMTMLVAPPPPPPPPPPASAAAKMKTTSTATATKAPVVKVNKTELNDLRMPTKIPQKIDMTPEAAAPAAPSASGVLGGVAGGVEGGMAGGVLGGVLSSDIGKLPAKPKLVRVSQGVSDGLLVHKVTPQYPPIAKQARMQGSVVLRAVIGKNGEVEHVQPESGNPLLASAAVNAVKQWRYKPYVLNGTPVDVETTVTVNFRLAA
jgi:protein TonB